MTILAYDELLTLIDQGVITGVTDEDVNGTSIDVHLGGSFLLEQLPIQDSFGPRIVDLAARQSPSMNSYSIPAGRAIDLLPEQFMLGCTREIFNLPHDLSAQFLLKSSVARAGLSHALATWADPGWHGSTLTLELHNLLSHHTLRLTVGMPIGQMIFHRHAPVPAHASYAARGRYNNDPQVQPQKL